MASEWVSHDKWVHLNAHGDRARGYGLLPQGSYLIQHDAGRTRCWVSTEQGEPVGSPHRMRASMIQRAAYYAPYEVELRDDPVPLTDEELLGQHVVPGG